ncbi:MAG: response regulator [Pseudomonadota bacterium]
MPQILVAEDDTAVREFICRALESYGHHADSAPHGGEALEKLHAGTYDLLITDIVMPVMDGIALSLAASSAYPAMPILLITGYSAERERAHNLDALIHDVLLKPFSLRQIGTAVERALRAAC